MRLDDETRANLGIMHHNPVATLCPGRHVRIGGSGFFAVPDKQ